MKRVLFTLLLSCLIYTGYSQSTYYWVGGAAGAWNGASSWSTTLGGAAVTRTPAATDILIFDGSNIGAGATGAINTNPTVDETIGQLMLQMQQTLLCREQDTGTQSLFISGGSGVDLQIAGNCKLSLAGATSFNQNLVITSSSTGEIYGNVVISGPGQNKIIPQAVNSVNFMNGSTCTVSSGTSPFGTSGSSIPTTDRSVVFQSGATFTLAGGTANPFGGSSANIIQFSSGSNFVLETATVATGLFSNARVLGNVRIRNNVTHTADGNPYNVDTLTIEAGSTFNLRATGTFPVSGDIINNGNFGSNTGYTTSHLILDGIVPQSIYGTGTFNPFGAISVATNSNVTQNTNLVIGGTTTSTITGKLNVKNFTISGSGAINFRGANSATGVPATLTSGSNVVTVNAAAYAGANISIGVLVSGTGIPGNTYIIATNSGASQFTMSKAATVTTTTDGASLTTVGNSPTLQLSNAGGVDAAVATSGSRTVSSSTNFIYDAATTSPFSSVSTGVNNITANASITLNKAMSVFGVLTVNSGSLSTSSFVLTLGAAASATFAAGTELNINNATGEANLAGRPLTLRSNATGTARIATVLGALNNATAVTLERYVPGRRAYRYLAHPFSTPLILQALQDDIDITGAGGNTNGFTTTLTNSPSAYRWVGSSATIADSSGWQAFPTAFEPWNQYEGIAVTVRGAIGEGLNGGAYTPSPVTLDVTGTPNVGTQTVQLTKFAHTEYNLVGNPFASAVNMLLVSRGAGITASTYYLWDPYMATAGAYRTVPWASTYSLPSSAAFFVEASTAVPADNTIIFEEADKVAADTTTVLRTNNSGNRMNLQLETGGILWDRQEFIFDANASTAKQYEDGAKFMNPEVSLYSLSSDGKELSIDARPVNLNTVIALGLKTDAPRSYILRVTDLDLPVNISAYIKDKYNNNTLTALTAGSTFNFTITADPASAAANRFDIVFAPVAPLPLTLTNIKAYQAPFGIQVAWDVENESGLNGYEVERSSNGTQFTKLGTVAALNNTTVSSAYSYLDNSPLNGVNYYRLKIIDKSGSFTYSKVVKVNLGKSVSLISVYPNPVRDNIVNVEFGNVAKGAYTVTLSNKLGQEVFRSVINHNGGSATETLHIAKQLEAGIYQLQVTGTAINKVIQVSVE